MIKRINKISQIGVFNDFAEPSCQFNKITIVYGFNTYGKSTLSDVFQSLSHNKSDLIINRKTIPESGKPQKVEISFGAPNTQENLIKYENDKWQKSGMKDAIEVFGTSFIHDNVFTGLTFHRANKEKFTDFILGAEGVKLAYQIENLKENRRVKKTGLDDSTPPFVKGKSKAEIDAFIALDVKETLQQINDNLHRIQEDTQQLKSILSNSAEILKKQEPVRLSFNKRSLNKIIWRINKLLKNSYESMQHDSLERIKIHLAENTNDINRAGPWLKDGIDIRKESCNNCPFCGQDLKAVKSLINAYESYFSEEYEKYSEKCISGLKQCMELMENINYDIHSALLKNLSVLKDYDKLIADRVFKDGLIKYETLVEPFQILETNTKKSYLEIVKILRKSIDKKKYAPHMPLPAFSYRTTDFRAILLREYYTKMREAQKLIIKLKQHIVNFKKGLTSQETAENVKKMELEITQLITRQARIEQADLCRNYTQEVREIYGLELQLLKAQEQIVQTQSDYVKTYFKMTDQLFKQLGSNDYTLLKEDTDRGDKKVYGVSVQFKGKPIPNDKISVVFSDSDRRALALSLFMAKLMLMQPSDLANTIVILDDPSTSFDDNRITKTIELIGDLSKKVSQVILLSHYPIFIKRFFELKMSATLYEIEKLATTIKFKLRDEDYFCKSDHAKSYERIMNYVNCQTLEVPRHEIRVFFENQLRTMYQKQILDYNLQNQQLGPLLEGLRDNHVIRIDTFDRMDRYRVYLNIEHHAYSSANPEEIRQQAKDIMEFLFNIDFKN